MALAVNSLTSGQDSTDATSYSTASITPTTNALVFVDVATRTAAATTNQPTVTGCSLTWVAEKTQLRSGTANRRLTRFRGMGTPTTGTLLIDFAGQTQTQCGFSVFEITGVDTSGTNGSGACVQSVSANDGGSAGTTSTVTLSSFGSSNNMAVGAKVHFTGEATTPGTGFTEIHDVTVTDGAGLETEYKLNTTSVTASWATSDNWIALATEVKQATTSTSTGNFFAFL